MKLTKDQIRLHEQCEVLLKKDKLTYEEKCFVYENWFPAYKDNIGKSGAFFTPFSLLSTFNVHVCGKRIVDLCAGIGSLSFYYYHVANTFDQIKVDVTCIERNPDFVAVGKKLFPEATWICADVLDPTIYENKTWDCVVSNPPYGKIKTSDVSNWLNYKGSEFEYKIIEIGYKIADDGVFLIPRGSSPYESTNLYFKEVENSKYNKFYKETGIRLHNNCGISCDDWVNEWKGTKINTEIVLIDKYEDKINFGK